MPEPIPAVAPHFEWRTTSAGRVLVCITLEAIASHAFTTRDWTGRPGLHDPDYDALGAIFGLTAENVARVRQVHGRVVQLVSSDVAASEPIGDADSLVSVTSGCAVSVRVADCVPILLADRHHRVVAAVHAGWRGTVAGIATATVKAIERLGIPASTLVAAVGPSIGPCCYQVDSTVREAFRQAYADFDDWFVPDGTERWKLDLWRANRAQLESAGVPSSSISIAGMCTADDLTNWYSFRKEGTGTGRMVAAIRRRPT